MEVWGEEVKILFLMQESAVLERAVKEQERRQGHKEGFSESPGDCLAYKYYRDVGLGCATV